MPRIVPPGLDASECGNPTRGTIELEKPNRMNARTDLKTEPQNALEAEVAALIVQALNLEIAAPDIDPNAPLFREGLELDSIDMLEIALEVSKRYGFQLRSDDTDNARIFASLRALTAHIDTHRAK